jgi:hypothetical protein
MMLRSASACPLWNLSSVILILKLQLWGLDDDHAKAYSEFVEHLADDDYNSELVVIAPHGGDIEEHADEQAQYVAQQLPSNCVSVWMCKGFKKGGGAFARWHITSTDISEESFPKLRTVYGRQFKFAIAFHGWGGDSICIGGSEPDPDNPDCLREEISLEEEIKCAIEKAVSGSESDPDGLIEVVLGDDGDGDKRCPQNFNGNNPKNFANRLGTTAVPMNSVRRLGMTSIALKSLTQLSKPSVQSSQYEWDHVDWCLGVKIQQE